MQQKSELPEGWSFCTLEEIGKWSTGGTPSRKVKEYFNGDVPWVKSGDLKDNVVTDTEEKITQAALENSSAKLLPAGFVSIALYGATIGKLGIVNTDAATNQACANCQVNPCLINRAFLFYYLLSQREELVKAGQGGAQPNITNKIIREWSMTLPPLPEQHRIVTAIEALFTRLDAANERLDMVPETMKAFRQAVLAAAFEGRLTEEWRKENVGIEPVSLTLSNLQAKQSSKSRANYNVKELDISKLPDLPEKWEWHPIISVSSRVTVGYVGPMRDEYIEDGIPFLRSQNVRENRYDSAGLKFISPEFHASIKKSALEPNDVVVVRSGNVGVSCVIPHNLKEANCSDLVIIKQPFGFTSKFGSYYLNSISKTTIDSNKVGIALSHFNTQSVANLPIPLPPLPEQQEIVRRVDALFAFAGSVEAKVAAAREKTERLRQSILAKAFSGELVPTEAEIARQEGRGYESAGELMGRIGKEGKVSAKGDS
jgi:type I restriction enzyme S subunit